MVEENFGHLGSDFQLKLIKVLIEDKKFTSTILDVIESKYFDSPYFKYIIENIKELYTLYNIIPSYDTLKEKVMAENSKNTTLKVHLDTLEDIRKFEVPDVQWVKNTTLLFCKQQVLKRELKVVQKIIDQGHFTEYPKIEKIIQDALQVGIDSNDVRDAFENIESVLEKDSRIPIPTGVNGIDRVLKGGLGIGELGVVLAPTGVGKTTILTKFANSAFNSGFKVLHIFFEDNMNNVLKKHYTIWTGISPDDQVTRKDEVITIVKQKKNESKGVLKLIKLPSDSLTVSGLKSKLRKLATEGFIPDLLVIDYVDCIVQENSNMLGEEWKSEGSIMRHLEAMTSEFEIALWTATQGNRDSISSEVVTTDQMGGSIKKAQIGHVVISVGKTLEQKEHNLATVTILKSRIGPDGIIFTNCKFNNEYLDIDTESQTTLLGHEEDKIKKRANRQKEMYERAQQKRNPQIIKEENK